MAKKTIMIDRLYFNAYRSDFASGTLHGYANLQVRIPGVLGGEDFVLAISGVQVKTLNGKNRIDFPVQRDGETGKVKLNEEGKAYSTVFPCSAKTREVLTALVFSNPAVAQAVADASNDDTQEYAIGSDTSWM